jgi:hypothetical protein
MKNIFNKKILVFFITLLICASGSIFIKTTNVRAQEEVFNPNDAIVNTFMNALKLTTVFPGPTDTVTGRILGKKDVTLRVALLGSLLFLFTAGVFLAAGFMILLRFVKFILLMIFSPVAFLGIIKKQQATQMFWSGLIGETIWLPVFMICIYLSTEILNSPGFQQSIFQTGIKAGEGFAAFSVKGNGIVILNFVIVISFIVASLIIAKSMGAWGSGKAEVFSRKFVGNVAGGALGFAGRHVIGRGASWGFKKSTRLHQWAQDGKKPADWALRGMAGLGAASFDFRNLGAVSGLTGKGKGGYQQFLSEQAASRLAFSKSLGSTPEDDAEMKRKQTDVKKLEREKAEIINDQRSLREETEEDIKEKAGLEKEEGDLRKQESEKETEIGEEERVVKEIRDREKKIQDTENELRVAQTVVNEERALDSAENELKIAKRRVEATKSTPNSSDHKKNLENLKQAEEKVEGARKVVDAKRQKASEKEEELDKLRSGFDTKTETARAREAEDKISKLRAEANKLKQERETRAKRINELNESVGINSKEIGNMAKEISNRNTVIAEVNEEIAKIKARPMVRYAVAIEKKASPENLFLKVARKEKEGAAKIKAEFRKSGFDKIRETLIQGGGGGEEGQKLADYTKQ